MNKRMAEDLRWPDLHGQEDYPGLLRHLMEIHGVLLTKAEAHRMSRNNLADLHDLHHGDES